MTIEDAIQHHRKVATTFKDKDSEQLADWLTELQEYRAKAAAKPKSNGDKIRQMTDEELAKLIEPEMKCNECPRKNSICFSGDCIKAAVQWLKQEANKDASD